MPPFDDQNDNSQPTAPKVDSVENNPLQKFAGVLTNPNTRAQFLIDTRAQTHTLIETGVLPDLKLDQPSRHKSITTADGRRSDLNVRGGNVVENSGNISPKLDGSPGQRHKQTVNGDGDVFDKSTTEQPDTLYRSDGTRVISDKQGRITSIIYNDNSHRSFVYMGDSSKPYRIRERDGNVWEQDETGAYHEHRVLTPFKDLKLPTGSTNDESPLISEDGTYSLVGKDGNGETRYTDGSTVKKNGNEIEITNKAGITNKYIQEDGQTYYLGSGGDKQPVTIDDTGNVRSSEGNSDWLAKRDGSIVSYDKSGRIQAVYQPLGKSKSVPNGNSFEYDENGNITAKVAANPNDSSWRKNDSTGKFDEYKNGQATGYVSDFSKIELDEAGNEIDTSESGDHRKVLWTDGRVTEDSSRK